MLCSNIDVLMLCYVIMAPKPPPIFITSSDTYYVSEDVIKIGGGFGAIISPWGI